MSPHRPRQIQAQSIPSHISDVTMTSLVVSEQTPIASNGIDQKLHKLKLAIRSDSNSSDQGSFSVSLFGGGLNV
jgi:hypothetical protein